MNTHIFSMLRCGAVFLGLLALPIAAATVDMPAADQAPAGRGAPFQQQFLENGASLVTTAKQRYCAVSRRIDIANSDYRTADGSVMQWDQVIRSPAASTQAMAGPEGMMGFRVQLKYSPAPRAGITLFIGDASEEVAGLLEPSTDSLRFGGDLAVRLASAFRDGTPVRVVAQSRDTGRRVGDTLAPPDLGALEACQTELAGLPDAGLPPMANQVSLDFDATPDPSSLATLDEMHTCGMKPTEAPLHLGRIRSTTGFFSHTDKVFVTFNDAGRVDRVYVPGLLDAGFAGGGFGEAQVSQSADGNLPDAENKVTGCIGASALRLCHIPEVGGSGHRLQVCDPLPGDGNSDKLAFLESPDNGGLPGSGNPTGNSPGNPRGNSPGGPNIPVLPPPSSFEDGSGNNEEVPPPPPPPSPVPLPPAGLLLVGALGGLAVLRRRRTTV